MKPTAFDTWLDEIASLTEPQRRRAREALALSETADSRGVEPRSPTDQDAFRLAQADAARPTDRVGMASVAELEQRRVDSVGCPHCENHDVVRWGHASDLPRYRCKVCAATPVYLREHLGLAAAMGPACGQAQPNRA